MSGTSEGARKRLTDRDYAAMSPIFGMDPQQLKEFSEQQAEKARRRALGDFGHVCTREDLGEYGR